MLGREAVAMIVLVRGDTEVGSWPLDGCGCPDLSWVDGLARLHLAARRFGCAILVRDASDELAGLLALCGLGDVLGGAGG